MEIKTITKYNRKFSLVETSSLTHMLVRILNSTDLHSFEPQLDEALEDLTTIWMIVYNELENERLKKELKMSRSTQEIGLTAEAKKMTEQWGRVKNSKNWTGGMFGEEVWLGEWRREDGSFVREIVQADPWSSGPMIFTCLAVYKTKAKGVKREGGMYMKHDFNEPKDKHEGEVIEESKWVDIWPAPKDEFNYSPEFDREKGEFYFGLIGFDDED